MSSKDLHSDIFGVPAISSVQISDTTTQVGAIIDTQGFYGLEFVTNVGAIVDLGAIFNVVIEDGDESDLSDAAPVDQTWLIGTLADAGFTNANANSIRRIGYVGGKRYVRYTIVPAVNAAAADFGVVAIDYLPRSAPAAENT